jgi:hypothetical protein
MNLQHLELTDALNTNWNSRIDPLLSNFEIGFRKLKKRCARSTPANSRKNRGYGSCFFSMHIVIGIFFDNAKAARSASCDA